ncbi:hypothetical protein V5D56_12420 [Cellulosimicrobium sp. PMB13]|uniref:hypothetical protein n=1 Tax=Cellulosimicrobium sp. PMB13 TaxID=3120158 RepID=UPI003F4CAAF3
MSTRAVVLPATPLLVPGAAGRAEVLRELRAAALDALRELTGGVAPVVVVAAVPTGALVRGPAAASLAAVGVRRTAGDPSWVDPGDDLARTGEPPARQAGVGASVALLALGACGVRGALDVVEVGPHTTTDVASDLGRELRADGVSLVVADDPRWASTDVVLGAFVDAAWSVRSEQLHEDDIDERYAIRRYVAADAAVGAPGHRYRSAGEP